MNFMYNVKPNFRNGSAIFLLAGILILPLPAIAQDAPSIDALGSKRIRLSHIDPNRCIKILQVYGFHIGKTGKAIDPAQLPVIIPLPSTALHKTVGNPGTDLPLTESDPLNELLAFYDPAHPEQLSRVINTIEQIIDVPARQIIIEAMILEIADVSLNQLGIDWTLMNPSDHLQTLRLGQLLKSPNGSSTIDLTASSIFGSFDIKLQALIESGEAEILSRPSILTLNNRMAYINVSRKIPVAEGQLNKYGELTSISFKEKTAGIELSVRPRISKREREVGMQISASVSAIVPNEDVELINSDGLVVASAPTISVREVKTYARVANNTPFIIGGLVAKDDISTSAEVPWLGKLPLLGWMFRNDAQSQLKREVIIVITPYILPEEEIAGTQTGEKSITLRTLPKDDDAFDSFDNRLFRPNYRIRSTDVFDLDFLTQNEQLKKMQILTDLITSKNVLLKTKYPWSSFIDGHVPGEQILVFRQMYEVIKRTNISNEIDTENIIFFEKSDTESSGFEVKFLNRYLEEIATKLWENEHANITHLEQPKDLWKRIDKRAIALTYTLQQQSINPEDILSQPVPEIQILDCPDKATYNRILWDLNQPTEDGQERHTLLISNPKDIFRIKNSILLRQTVELNATQKSLTLDNFSIGQNLLLPDINKDRINLIDSNVAKYFFLSDQYYQALRLILDKDIEALQKELETP